MSDSPEMTPQDGSLDSATDALSGLLSKLEKKEPAESKPEPSKAEAAPETKLAESEPEEEIETEQSEEPEPEPEAKTQPRTFKVKVDGKEVEVPEDELLSGYSRTRDYTLKTQALAEQKRQFEESIVKQQRERDAQWASQLEEFKKALGNIIPQKPDFEKLKRELPPEQYAAKLEEWQGHQERLEQVEKQQAEVRARQEEFAKGEYQKRLQAEQKLLVEKLPDLADPDKADSLRESLVEQAMHYGFSAQDLEQVSDHRAFLMLHDAMQWRKQQAKAPQIKNKIEKVMEPNRPGAKKEPSDSRGAKYTEASTRLRQTGKLDDAANALTALLERHS